MGDFMTDRIIIKPYCLTVRDYIALVVDTYYRPIVTLPGIATYPLIAILLACMLSAPSLSHGKYLNTALWILAQLAVWLIIIPGFSLWQVWKTAKSSTAALATRTLQYNDEGVHIQGEGFDSHLTWSSFHKIIETKSYLYLMRIREAHIVPISAFQTPVDAQDFAGVCSHPYQKCRPRTDRRLLRKPAGY